MTSTNEIEAILLDAFEDVALLIGAAAGAAQFDDSVVWMMMRRLYRLRLRALSRLPAVSGRVPSEPAAVLPAGAHPAVENFLHLNRGVCLQGGAGEGTDAANMDRFIDGESRESGGITS